MANGYIRHLVVHGIVYSSMEAKPVGELQQWECTNCGWRSGEWDIDYLPEAVANENRQREAALFHAERCGVR